MSDQDIERIKEQIGAWGRDDWHDFRRCLDATAIAVAVVQRVQDAQSKQLDRIETAVSGKLEAHGTRLTVLEAQSNHASATGRNWGLSAGAIGTGIAAALAYFFGGK